jgi:hypothetical protein
MSAYENLALTNFYLGKIDKSDYYCERFFRGKSEAQFSGVKKISLAHTRRKYKHMKHIPFKCDVGQSNMLKNGAIDKQSVQVGLKELFS